jgi:hypothetical protein
MCEAIAGRILKRVLTSSPENFTIALQPPIYNVCVVPGTRERYLYGQLGSVIVKFSGEFVRFSDRFVSLSNAYYL